MFSPSRRSFLGASLAGVATARLFGADPPPVNVEDSPFRPETLFLTWQRDPTTTMTVQWVGTVGETPDTKIYYTPNLLGQWQTLPTAAKRYPMTDFHIFRAELTGLTPGANYWFRIGKQSPLYNFRTMPAKANNTIHF